MNFTPIKLTIVDFLGVFLPGTIWIVLFASLRDTIILTYHHFGYTLVKCPNQYPNPLNKGLYILTLSNDEYGTNFYLGLTLVAVILGYLNMSLSTQFTEWLSHLDVWIKSFWNCDKYKGKVFPYPNQFENSLYFKSINHYIVNTFNNFLYDQKITINEKREKFSDLDLQLYQPFESCKRLLKLHAPTLWEEVQDVYLSTFIVLIDHNSEKNQKN